MAIQRHVCGAIGLAMTALGVGLLIAQSSHVVVSSALLRAGSLLMVTWLAWPKLIQWKDSFPRTAVVSLVILAGVLVLRPSWGKIGSLVAIALVGASLVGRWLSQKKTGG